MATFKLIFLFGALLALLPFFITHTTRRAYPLPPPQGAAIILSGASTGIGYDAAINLVDDNFIVFAGVRKDTDADTLNALGKKNLVPIKLDVTSQESIDAAYDFVVKDAEARGVPVWGLVNNAGIMTGASFEFHSLEAMQKIFDVNVWGVVRLTQKFLPLLRANQGRIIQISSVAGFFTIPRASAYCSSKHALEALSDGLRMELDSFNVSVTVVQPGAVRSAIFDKAQEAMKASIEDSRELEVYGHMVKERESMMEKADTPEVTTRAIREGLVSEYPPTRIVVANLDGVPAWVGKVMKWVLPDRVLDRMMLSAF